MLDIQLKTIPSREQRYNTVGDYQTNESGKKEILISDMGDSRYELLVAIHELIETALCDERGISEKSIDAFDLAFEQNRSPEDTASEPGNQQDAPYNKEHIFATKIEMMFAEELGVNWDEYNEMCRKLTTEYLKKK